MSKNLSRVPYPYTEDDALRVHRQDRRTIGGRHRLRVCGVAQAGRLHRHCAASIPSADWEFGYWLGKPYWGQGYATEAGGRVVAFAFEELKAERLNAGWFHDNPASGRVLAKLGFRPAGEGEIACVSRGGHGYLSSSSRLTARPT